MSIFSIRGIAVLLAALLLGLVISGRALAQDEAADRSFIFGTRLVLTSSTQLSQPPNYNWWGDKLPMEYNYAVGTIVKTVNEARSARGDERMIQYRDYPVSIGGDVQNGDKWEYWIDFMKMSPADVQVVMEAFPLTGEFSDLPTELRPVSSGYFWKNSQDGSAVSIDLPGGTLEVSPSMAFEDAWQAVNGNLKDYFGMDVKFDLYLSHSRTAGGYNSFDVSVTVYMDDSWQNNGGYPVEYD